MQVQCLVTRELDGAEMSSGVGTDPGQELGPECTKRLSLAHHGEDGVELSVEVRVVPSAPRKLSGWSPAL